MSLIYSVEIRECEDGWRWRVAASERAAWNWTRMSEGRSWSGTAESFATAATQASKRLRDMPGV